MPRLLPTKSARRVGALRGSTNASRVACAGPADPPRLRGGWEVLGAEAPDHLAPQVLQAFPCGPSLRQDAGRADGEAFVPDAEAVVARSNGQRRLHETSGRRVEDLTVPTDFEGVDGGVQVAGAGGNHLLVDESRQDARHFFQGGRYPVRETQDGADAPPHAARSEPEGIRGFAVAQPSGEAVPQVFVVPPDRPGVRGKPVLVAALHSFAGPFRRPPPGAVRRPP